jgi:hypothetical protein
MTINVVPVFKSYDQWRQNASPAIRIRCVEGGLAHPERCTGARIQPFL